MLGPVRQYLHEAAFYLPGLDAELNRLETQKERNAARWHIWRRLFRSWQYWVYVGGVALSVPAIVLGWGAVQASLPRLLPGAWLSPVVTLTIGVVYAMTLACIVALGGFLPLRSLVQRELTAYFQSIGLWVCECGYDLRGAIHARCPECGRATVRET